MIFGLDPSYTSWGPFIDHDKYKIQSVSRSDLITAGAAFAFCVIFAISAAYVGYKQTRRSRQPWTSAYIWMVWLEWSASVVLAIECLLFLLRVIRPSFYFFLSIRKSIQHLSTAHQVADYTLVLLWTIQTQCLLQIIVNRIRIIVHNRKKGKWLMIGTLVYMSLINVSVFCIWVPARMQINSRYVNRATSPIAV
jgi:hypothetical protein